MLGAGDRSGSKQTYRDSGHLCLYRSREIHFLLLQVAYQSRWQMFASVPGVSEQQLQGWWRNLLYNQAHICPFCHPPSWKQPFHHSWQLQRKCFQTVLSYSVSTVQYNVNKVCFFWVTCVWFLTVALKCQKVILSPLSLVADGGKEALRTDGFTSYRPHQWFLCPISSGCF